MTEAERVLVKTFIELGYKEQEGANRGRKILTNAALSFGVAVLCMGAGVLAGLTIKAPVHTGIALMPLIFGVAITALICQRIRVPLAPWLAAGMAALPLSFIAIDNVDCWGWFCIAVSTLFLIPTIHVIRP